MVCGIRQAYLHLVDNYLRDIQNFAAVQKRDGALRGNLSKGSTKCPAHPNEELSLRRSAGRADDLRWAANASRGYSPLIQSITIYLSSKRTMAKVTRREKVISVAGSCRASSTPELVEDGWTGALSLNSKRGTSTCEADEPPSPNAMTCLEDPSPKNPITSILNHVAEKGRLFGQEDELVNEVPA